MAEDWQKTLESLTLEQLRSFARLTLDRDPDLQRELQCFAQEPPQNNDGQGMQGLQDLQDNVAVQNSEEPDDVLATEKADTELSSWIQTMDAILVKNGSDASADLIAIAEDMDHLIANQIEAFLRENLPWKAHAFCQEAYYWMAGKVDRLEPQSIGLSSAPHLLQAVMNSCCRAWASIVPATPTNERKRMMNELLDIPWPWSKDPLAALMRELREQEDENAKEEANKKEAAEVERRWLKFDAAKSRTRIEETDSENSAEVAAWIQAMDSILENHSRDPEMDFNGITEDMDHLITEQTAAFRQENMPWKAHTFCLEAYYWMAGKVRELDPKGILLITAPSLLRAVMDSCCRAWTSIVPATPVYERQIIMQVLMNIPWPWANNPLSVLLWDLRKQEEENAKEEANRKEAAEVERRWLRFDEDKPLTHTEVADGENSAEVAAWLQTMDAILEKDGRDPNADFYGIAEDMDHLIAEQTEAFLQENLPLKAHSFCQEAYYWMAGKVRELDPKSILLITAPSLLRTVMDSCCRAWASIVPAAPVNERQNLMQELMNIPWPWANNPLSVLLRELREQEEKNAKDAAEIERRWLKFDEAKSRTRIEVADGENSAEVAAWVQTMDAILEKDGRDPNADFNGIAEDMDHLIAEQTEAFLQENLPLKAHSFCQEAYYWMAGKVRELDPKSILLITAPSLLRAVMGSCCQAWTSIVPATPATERIIMMNELMNIPWPWANDPLAVLMRDLREQEEKKVKEEANKKEDAEVELRWFKFDKDKPRTWAEEADGENSAEVAAWLQAMDAILEKDGMDLNADFYGIAEDIDHLIEEQTEAFLHGNLPWKAHAFCREAYYWMAEKVREQDPKSILLITAPSLLRAVMDSCCCAWSSIVPAAPVNERKKMMNELMNIPWPWANDPLSALLQELREQEKEQEQEKEKEQEKESAMVKAKEDAEVEQRWLTLDSAKTDLPTEEADSEEPSAEVEAWLQTMDAVLEKNGRDSNADFNGIAEDMDHLIAEQTDAFLQENLPWKAHAFCQEAYYWMAGKVRDLDPKSIVLTSAPYLLQAVMDSCCRAWDNIMPATPAKERQKMMNELLEIPWPWANDPLAVLLRKFRDEKLVVVVKSRDKPRYTAQDMERLVHGDNPEDTEEDLEWPVFGDDPEDTEENREWPVFGDDPEDTEENREWPVFGDDPEENQERPVFGDVPEDTEEDQEWPVFGDDPEDTFEFPEISLEEDDSAWHQLIQQTVEGLDLTDPQVVHTCCKRLIRLTVTRVHGFLQAGLPLKAHWFTVVMYEEAEDLQSLAKEQDNGFGDDLSENEHASITLKDMMNICVDSWKLILSVASNDEKPRIFGDLLDLCYGEWGSYAEEVLLQSSWGQKEQVELLDYLREAIENTDSLERRAQLMRKLIDTTKSVAWNDRPESGNAIQAWQEDLKRKVTSYDLRRPNTLSGLLSDLEDMLIQKVRALVQCKDYLGAYQHTMVSYLQINSLQDHLQSGELLSYDWELSNTSRMSLSIALVNCGELIGAIACLATAEIRHEMFQDLFTIAKQHPYALTEPLIEGPWDQDELEEVLQFLEQQRAYAPSDDLEGNIDTLQSRLANPHDLGRTWPTDALLGENDAEAP